MSIPGPEYASDAIASAVREAVKRRLLETGGLPDPSPHRLVVPEVSLPHTDGDPSEAVAGAVWTTITRRSVP